MSDIEKIKNLLKKKYKLAVFVDGPNILRKDVNLSLKEIKEKIQQIGSIRICKVYLNQKAPAKLVEAAINEGYEVITTPSDVDVCMAVDATSAIFNPAINIIVLVTRDTDFHFVLKKAKELGKGTIVVAAKENFSSALKNTSDETILLEGSKEENLYEEKEKNEMKEKEGEISIDDKKIEIVEKEEPKGRKRDIVIKNIMEKIEKLKKKKENLRINFC